MADKREGGNQRTPEQKREHYLIERELADRLRVASRQQRLHLYRVVYDELFERVPLHPERTRRRSTEEIGRTVASQLRFLRRFLQRNQTFLEVGPGDCALSFAVAPMVRKVYAVDVSSANAEESNQPPNFERRFSDGCSIDLPTNSVDLAYSNQVIEHLHPEDAAEQLQNLHRVLVPGGRYVCITGNRLNGPHDVSRGFTETATGFHLREYTHREVSDLFRRSGFSSVSVYLGVKGRFCKLPMLAFELVETTLSALPDFLRRELGNRLPFRLFMEIRVVGTR
jgi:SAM-dependent methyltransferase